MLVRGPPDGGASGHVPAPGQLANVVATVDEISGGRVEVGLGAGWFEVEHRRFGFPMPSLSARYDMLEDSLAILEPIWGPDGRSFDGRVWSLVDTASLLKPVAGRTPVPDGLRRAVVGAIPAPRPASTPRDARSVTRRDVTHPTRAGPMPPPGSNPLDATNVCF